MPEVPNALARLDKAVALLKEARTLDEVGQIRATAAAAAEYARAEKLGDEAIHYAEEVKVRAARRAGELLAQMNEKATGTRGKVQAGMKGYAESGDTRRASPVEPPPTLKEMGITPKESARWQKIAAIPEERFEAIVRREKVPTETKVAKAAPAKKTTITLPSDWVDDDPNCTRVTFLRLCHDMVGMDAPRKAARRFMRPQTKFHQPKDQARYLDAAKSAAEWLTEFLDEWTKEGTADVEPIRKAR